MEDTIKTVTFVAGPEATAVIEAYVTHRRKVNDAMAALGAEFGTDSIYYINDIGLVGFNPPTDGESEAWKAAVIDTLTRTKRSPYWAPNGRTKKGRALSARMKKECHYEQTPVSLTYKLLGSTTWFVRDGQLTMGTAGFKKVGGKFYITFDYNASNPCPVPMDSVLFDIEADDVAMAAIRCLVEKGYTPEQVRQAWDSVDTRAAGADHV